MSKKNIDVINLNKYTRINPHRLLIQGTKFVTNGTNNEFFYFVESRYFGSPTNQAIIDNYVNYIIGDGIEVIDGMEQETFDKILNEEDLRMLISEFKLQGNAPIQVIYSKSPDKKVARLHSIPAKNIAIVNQEDISQDIQEYWYCYDWFNRTRFKPYIVPAFGTMGKGSRETEIYYLQRHSPQPLFALPDYISGIQYCEVEEEMSNYYINHIRNNFSAGKLVNINQGEAETEEAEEFARRKIIKDLSGTSNAGNVIVSFNANKEQETTIEDIQIVDAYQQFETLSKESREKIMLAHKVNNPGLFGFSHATGFSDGTEIDLALKMLYRSQINPMRRIILNALEEILSINNPDIKLDFIDFKDLETSEDIKNDNGVGLKKKETVESIDSKNIDEFIKKGEIIDESKWRLIDIDEEVELIDSNIELYTDTGVAQPSASSRLDLPSRYDSVFKIRFRYDGNKSPEREFCRKMMSANKLYRIEDIERMMLSNPAFSPAGSGQGGYSVKIYKGGKWCKHFWVREIYTNKERTRQSDPNKPGAELVSVGKMIREIGIQPEVLDPRMWQTPNSMPNGGGLG